MNKLKNIRTMLIVNLGGIGDVVLSTPALKALRECYRGSEIDMLVVPRVAEFARTLPYADNVFIFTKDALGVPGNIITLIRLRGRAYELAINMRTLASKRSAFKIKLLLDIINPRTRVGWDTDGLGGFFDIKIPETLIGRKHETGYCIDTAEALGARVTDRRPEFNISPEEAEAADSLLEGKGIKKGDIIVGLNPGGHPTRRWPIERYAELVKELDKKAACKFIVTGSKDEARLAARLKELSGVDTVAFSGRLGIKVLGAVIKRCSLYISNDTGPLHIAAALGIPLIAIFGPGDITRFDPRNISDKADVFYKKAECSPCSVKACRDLKCLEAISADEVIEAALKWIR